MANYLSCLEQGANVMGWSYRGSLLYRAADLFRMGMQLS